MSPGLRKAKKYFSCFKSEADEEFIWSSAPSKHSAQALVNVNFKNATEHFGLRGRQEHYAMMVEDFKIITSPDSAVKYVKYVTYKEGPKGL